MLYSQPQISDDAGRGLVWTGDAAPTASDPQRQAVAESRFQAVLRAVIAILQRERRVTYRTVNHVLGIDAALLHEIREELTLRRLASDEEGKVLVWTGDAHPPISPAVAVPGQPASADIAAVTPPERVTLPPPATAVDAPSHGPTAPAETSALAALPDAPVVPPEPSHSAPEAERRQLTVMFCDLADSTALAQQLDAEDLREVVRAYQATAAEVIQQYEGTIAQYLGDGLLVYFGWPSAHEDDAPRAVHAGLDIVEAITTTLNPHLERDRGVQLAVRVGIHTGPVVVGEMGGAGRQEHLATGDTVNIAARLEGLAVPNTVVISSVMARLIRGAFALENLGSQGLKGVLEPIVVYRVRAALERLADDTMAEGVPFLVGREEEMGLLRRRWQQAQESLGQVVLISGAAGIGKSALVSTLRQHVGHHGVTRMTFRCSPYHTNSALYPVVEHLQRVLRWQPDDTPDDKCAKLEQVLQTTRLPLEEAMPLFAALLAVPLPAQRYTPLTLSPQQQRQQTSDTLVAWLLEEAERYPVLAVWEDVHWADPSSLEFLGLLIEQMPTVPMLQVLTFRPEFIPPWRTRSHLTPMTLNRLERPQVEALITWLTGGKALPTEVVEHIVAKTDGVPLYVEELTKMLLESDLLQETPDAYTLTGPLLSVAIPDTLQDSLMARLDQLNTAKEFAQLGAVLGREFDYAMLRAIASQDEALVQAGLAQLVEAELLYQRGRPPRARYVFKHALIQDAAYASLLRSTRQRVHQQIADLLVAQFPGLVETQPELLAYHYTEAACHTQAVAYWQQAGQRAVQRSAYAEASHHLTQGLVLLDALPESPERAETELGLRTTLGPVLMATKGQAASDVEHNYARARQLCQQVGDTPQVFPVMWGLWRFYNVGAQYRIARELGEQLLTLAQHTEEATHRLAAHHALSFTLVPIGEFALGHEHFAQVRTHYHRDLHRGLVAICAQDSGVTCLALDTWALWALGTPQQAIHRNQEAINLAQELSHPLSLAWALICVAWIRQLRREVDATLDVSESAIALATEHGFPAWRAWGAIMHGWGLAVQGHTTEGIEQIQQGLSLCQHINFIAVQTYALGLLADAYRYAGQMTEAGRRLGEALALADRTGEELYLAELHRLQGTFLLQQSAPDDQVEASFLQALDIARRQQAKSWELRAATSLARLWQSQGKHQASCNLLAPVYAWFTEGFDTADLQEARALLDTLRA